MSECLKCVCMTLESNLWHTHTHGHLAGALIQCDVHTQCLAKSAILIVASRPDRLRVTRDADSSKYVIMPDSHLLKLIQICTKYLAGHVCVSLPRAPTVSRPTLDFQKRSSKKCQRALASGPVTWTCKLNRNLVNLLGLEIMKEEGREDVLRERTRVIPSNSSANNCIFALTEPLVGTVRNVHRLSQPAVVLLQQQQQQNHSLFL